MGTLTLSDVYFVPNLATNLISIGQLVDCGYLAHFSPSGCVIQERQTRRMIGKGSKHGKLFLLDIGQPSLFASSMRVLNNIWTIWHKRLSHLNNANLLSLFKLGSLEKSVASTMFSSFHNRNVRLVA